MPVARRIRIVALATAGVLGAAIVGLWLGVPAAVRWGIETVGSREVGRTLRVNEVRFNPFTLTATLSGLGIAGLPGEKAPLLTIDSLRANLSAASLRHRAPVIESLQAHGIRASVVRVAENRFNFSDIFERLLARPPSREPARFALYNVEIDDAAIAFDDRVRKTTHSLTAIRLGVPFVSSLPDDVQIKVRPSFSAQLDGQPIALTAESQPFDAAQDTSVALKLSGLELPPYLGYVPLRLTFDLQRGTLDTDLRIHFMRGAPASKEAPARAAQLSVSGALALRDIAYAERGGATLLAWKRLDVTLDDIAVFAGHAKVRSIALGGAQANVVRRADGSIAGLGALIQPVERPAAPSAEAGQPFTFDIGTVKLSDAAVDFRDDGVRVARRVAPIALRLDGLSNRPGSAAKLSASLAADDSTQIAVNGDVALAPLKLALSAELTAVPLPSLLPYLRAFTTARVDGKVDAGARLLVEQVDAGTSIRLEDARLGATGVRVRSGTAALDLSQLVVAGGSADLAQRSAAIGQIRADGLRVAATRSADGRIDWAALLVEQKPMPDAKPPAPWNVRLGELQLNGARLQAVDRAVEPEARLAIDNIYLALRDLSTEGHERTSLNLRAAAGGGRIGARGWVRMVPLASSLDVDIGNIDVGALRPYLGRYTNAVLSSASVTTKGKLALDSRGEALRVAYDGAARLTNLALLDGGADSELLRWQALGLDAIRLRVGEGVPEIAVGAVQLTDFYARAILSAEGRLNLVDVFKSEPKEPPATAPAAPSAPPPLIRIGDVELARGNVNFTDHFVKPNYTANLTDLAGTVSALASDAANPADVSIRGRVDSDAPVEITGKVNPLAPKLFLDIAASAKGLELPRLTPYSVKYAGYPIVKGKLSMDVRYHVEDDELKADNHVFLDQLTFGERVESPTATKLPVLFAVSLLKNLRGEIDINLPISGSLNDPQFSIGGIIVRVIVNLIVKAVTAPFSLLAAAFGSGEELGYLEFPAGSTVPTAAETKKLDTLAKALNDRPALRLEIAGRADPAADTEPLRAAKLDAKLRAAKVRDIVKSGQSVDPATVTITDAERPALIARVYAEEKIPDKPRNIIGIAKTIPTADMEALILSTLTVGEPDLRQLANDRAAAVRDRLESQGKVARERLFLAAPKLSAEGIQDKGRPTRVDFSLK